jgi:hypothetical protein
MRSFGCHRDGRHAFKISNRILTCGFWLGLNGTRRGHHACEGLTSMMMVSSLFFVFIVTAAAGPVGAVAASAGVLIFGLAEAEIRAVRRGDAAAQAEAAEAAVMAEAEAVIAAARLRLERDAITVTVCGTQHRDGRSERKIAVGCPADLITPAEARGLATALIAAADAAEGKD